MTTTHETISQPNPRDTLKRFLDGESVGSPKWLRVADYFALSRAEAEIYLYGTYPQSIERQKAIASWAQINETIRNRMIGLDAVAYSQVNIEEVVPAYWEECKVPDPRAPGNCLIQESLFEIANRVLEDMQSIALASETDT